MADVADMSEEASFWHFVKIRFGSTTRIACPHCGVIDTHYFRKKQRRWSCKDCLTIFSSTSGTIFHGRKLPFKRLLLGITLFISSANGCSALRLHRDLKVQAKTAFVFAHKLREALQLIHEMPVMSGVIEMDGGHFGGRPRSGRIRRRPRPEAIAAKVSQQLMAQNAGKPKPRFRQTKANIERLKNRQIFFTIRQHSGKKDFGAVRTYVTVLKAETAEQVRDSILKMVAPGSTIMTDENPAYGWLESAGFVHETVNHQEEYSTPEGINENQAESFFSRLRRYVLGVSLRIVPKYMLDFGIEMAWREDWRRKTEGQKSHAITAGLLTQHHSKWRGYFQSNAAVNKIKT